MPAPVDGCSECAEAQEGADTGEARRGPDRNLVSRRAAESLKSVSLARLVIDPSARLTGGPSEFALTGEAMVAGFNSIQSRRTEDLPLNHKSPAILYGIAPN